MAVTLSFPSDFARLEYVLEQRRKGVTNYVLADRLQITPKQVSVLVSRAIKKVLRETAEEVRQMELGRVETLIAELWDATVADCKSEKPDFARLDRVKALIELKLRYCGAQAAKQEDNRVQIIVHGQTEELNAQRAYSAEIVGPASTSAAGLGGDAGEDAERDCDRPPPVREG